MHGLLAAAAAVALNAPPPAPYSIPFQLRPAAVPNVVRSDTSFAPHDGGTTVASMLLAGLRITPELGVLARFAYVGSPAGKRIVNPALGGTYLWKLNADWRVAFFLGVAIPTGGDPAAAAAGVLARSAMDNAMFAVNYLTIFPGVGIAYVAHGLTVQAEATVLELLRVRGNDEKARTNFTSGLHVGYFLIPELSVGAELRYQRFLKNDLLEGKPANDNLTVAAGARAHFHLGGTTWLRPGVSYARGLDDPMAAANYHIVQADVVVLF